MQLLLCTDLDRTVLPNGSQPESDGARSRFAMLAARPEVTLVYVTGRDRQLVRKAIANYCLPQPDYVISDVGTTIYEINDDSWQLWHEWQQEIAPDWAGLEHSDIRKLLLDIVDLHCRNRQSRTSTSQVFMCPCMPTRKPCHTTSVNVSRPVASGPTSSGASMNRAQVGLLDVLPARASKKHAVSFLMQRNGFALDDTVFAGDSGNDLPVLVSEIPAVLVANASAEVRREALDQAAAQGACRCPVHRTGGLHGHERQLHGRRAGRRRALPAGGPQLAVSWISIFTGDSGACQ